MGGYFFNLWSIPYFISFFISLAIAWLLLYKKREDEKARLCFTIMFIISILCLSAAMATCSLDPGDWFIWQSLDLSTSIIAVTILFHFSQLSLVNGKIFENNKLFLVYLLPLSFISILLVKTILLGPEVVTSDTSPFGLYTRQQSIASDLLSGFFYFSLGLMMILAIINFIRKFRANEDINLRRRSSYFVLACLVPLIGITITNFFEIFSIDIYTRLDLSIVSLSISGAIIAYGILKDKLFDIDLILTKSFSYTIITLVLSWIFLLSEESLNYFISESFFGGIAVSRLLSAVFVVALFFPFRDFSHKLSNRLLLSNRLFQHTVSTKKSRTNKNMEIYRRQLELALEDGIITKEESIMLKELRSSLGLSDEDHERLKRELIGNRDVEE